jgi:hypothetical protein
MIRNNKRDTTQPHDGLDTGLGILHLGCSHILVDRRMSLHCY